VDSGRYVVIPIGGHGSHVLGGLSQSNALIVVPSDVTRISDNDPVTVIDLGGAG
jgi:molybdopterin molybdotransferase